MPSVAVNEVVKYYGTTQALKGVTFEVGDGEVVGVLGPNGAGKTTLLSILATLMPQDCGSVRILDLPLPQRRRQVSVRLGLVPQQVGLFGMFSAVDNLRYFGRLYDVRGQRLEGRIREVIEMVGLEQHLAQRVDTFSPGMKRRLNIAAALLHSPEVLLLDEPMAGVDPQSRNRILEALSLLRTEGGTSVIYTTHYMEEAEQLCDRVVILDGGVVIADAPVDELLSGIRESTVELRFTARKTFVARIAALEGLSLEEVDEGVVRLRSSRPEPALTAVIGLAKRYKADIKAIDIRRPSLNEAFLALTGKELRD
jgi:ABC-2 type transport system ATP-binding protein